MFDNYSNSPEMRNFVKNLMNGAASKNFPGAQRNTTMRDAHAFTESPQTNKTAIIEETYGTGTVGTLQADP